MTAAEVVRSASAEIRSHKVRSALTALSLTIGVAAVLFTLSQIAWMQERMETRLALSGPGRIEIEEKQGYLSRGLSPGLTLDDAQEIRRRWPELHMVYPMVRRWGARFSYRDFRKDDFVVWGTNADWRKRDWVYETRGRFLNEGDVRSAARVCVLLQPGGWVKKPFWARYFPVKAVEKLLARRDLLGARVQIEDHLFTVVGIIKEPPRDKDRRWRRSNYGGSGDVIVPITAYRRYLMQRGKKETYTRVKEIMVDTGRESTISLYKRRIEVLLAARHRGEKDFEVKDFREVILGMLRRMREFAAAVLVIGVVAILAGGIGILNVTLATIYSRIREIGIRRAIGATRLDIISQFVAEAMLLGLGGGLAGTPLGFAAAKWLAPDPDRIIMPGVEHVSIALLIAVGTGFLFSVYPAYQASRFDPVEALRYE